jgi:hypothetical protein
VSAGCLRQERSSKQALSRDRIWAVSRMVASAVQMEGADVQVRRLHRCRTKASESACLRANEELEHCRQVHMKTGFHFGNML